MTVTGGRRGGVDGVDVAGLELVVIQCCCLDCYLWTGVCEDYVAWGVPIQ